MTSRHRGAGIIFASEGHTTRNSMQWRGVDWIISTSSSVCDDAETRRMCLTEGAVRTDDQPLLKRRQTTSGHVTPPLVVVAIVVSTVAVAVAVLVTLVVQCRRHRSQYYHHHHHHDRHSHQLATADKPPPSHVTTPFIVTSLRGGVTSHPVGRHAACDRVAPLMTQVRYDGAAGVRPS